jgi:hypothetical protein
MRRQKDGIVPLRVQFSVGTVDDARLRQDGTAFGLEILDDEIVLNGLWVSGRLRVRKLHAEQGEDQQNSSHRDSLTFNHQN